jgi:hypothetical protein
MLNGLEKCPVPKSSLTQERFKRKKIVIIRKGKTQM